MVKIVKYSNLYLKSIHKWRIARLQSSGAQQKPAEIEPARIAPSLPVLVPNKHSKLAKVPLPPPDALHAAHPLLKTSGFKKKDATVAWKLLHLARSYCGCCRSQSESHHDNEVPMSLLHVLGGIMRIKGPNKWCHICPCVLTCVGQ